MSVVLGDIIAAWKSDRPWSADHVRRAYVEHPNRIECSVATTDDGDIVGFQSLIVATDNNDWDVTAGWGFIGTYVKIGAGRRGIGTALFAATKQAAARARLPNIDATIGENNAHGLAYYEAMGFRTYRRRPGLISKVYTVAATVGAEPPAPDLVDPI